MWTRVGWAAACFAAILGFSRLAYGALVPPMRHELGGSYALYGAIGGANLVGYLSGTLLATRLGRRADRSRVNAFALGAMCLTMAASGLVRETLELGILRFLVGATSGVALALTLSLAVERISPARRGLAAAIVWGGGSLGIALVGAASIALPLTVPGAWRAQWIAMALVGALCATVFARLTGGAFAAAERRDDGGAIGLFDPARYLPLTLGYFCFGFGYIDVVTFFGAELLRTRTLPPGAAWIALGLAGLAGAAAWGPLIDRYRSGGSVALACGLCMLGSLVAVLPGAAFALAGASAIGFSFIGVPAMIGALLQQREPADRYPRAFASMTSFLGIGQILGPLTGGVLADRFGTTGAVLAGAVMLAIAASLVSRYRFPAEGADVVRVSSRRRRSCA